MRSFVVNVLPKGTITIGVTWDNPRTIPVSYYSPDELTSVVANMRPTAKPTCG